MYNILLANLNEVGLPVPALPTWRRSACCLRLVPVGRLGAIFCLMTNPVTLETTTLIRLKQRLGAITRLMFTSTIPAAHRSSAAARDPGRFAHDL